MDNNPATKYWREHHRKVLKNAQQFPGFLKKLSQDLGVPVEPMIAGEWGYQPILEKNTNGVFVIPERNEWGAVVGLSVRTLNHKKYMVKDSKHGLIFEPNPAFVAYQANPKRSAPSKKAAPQFIRCAENKVICPICEHEKSDGCLISNEDTEDPQAAICIRISEGCTRQMPLGFLHVRKPAAADQYEESGAVEEMPSILRPSPYAYQIVEGASDWAALTAKGLVCIGRPSNNAGNEMLAAILRPLGQPVVVWGENDARMVKGKLEKPGEQGATTACAFLRDHGIDALMCMPPKQYKDARSWTVHANPSLEEILARVKEHGTHVVAEEHKPAVAKALAKGKSSADLMVTLLDESNLEYFHNDSGDGFITYQIEANGAKTLKQTSSVKSKNAQKFLKRMFYEKTGASLPESAMKDVISLMEARATFDGPERSVHVRFGTGGPDVQYFDHGDAVTVMTPEGFTTIDDSPVAFIRATGMKIAPRAKQPPNPGDGFRWLRELVNLDDDQFILLIGHMVSAFMDRGTMPLLALGGVQGSGKSKALELERSVIDPNTAPLRGKSKDERNAMVSGAKSALIVLDNLSDLTADESDLYCRLLSGTGFGIRANYTDDDEILFQLRRPILASGIGDFITRGDLLDRTLRLKLPMISDSNRKTEAEWYGRLEEIVPYALWDVFNSVCAAMRNRKSVKLERLPRLADFAVWCVAAEEAMGFAHGSFMRAFNRNLQGNNELTVEFSSAGSLVLAVMEGKDSWEGTFGDLLAASERPGRVLDVDKSKLPRSAKGMSSAVDRVIPSLWSAYGIWMDRPTRGKSRLVRFTRKPRSTTPPPIPHQKR